MARFDKIDNMMKFIYDDSKKSQAIDDFMTKMINLTKTKDINKNNNEQVAEEKATREDRTSEKASRVNRASAQPSAEEGLRQDLQKFQEVMNNNNKITKRDIFDFDFSDSRVIEGFIFSEVLGKPVSKRRHSHGRAR